MFILTNKIIKQRPNGFTSATVVGKRSIGKSIYCLKVAVQLYMHLYDIAEEEAYQMAIDSCIFTIDDAIRMFDTKERTDIVIWDDVGVYASGALYHTDVFGFALLKGLMDTIRTSTHALLLNTPSQKGITSFLQNYDDFLVKINNHRGADSHVRIATGYSKYTLPSGARRVRKIWKDSYSCYIKNQYYNQYSNLRNSYKHDIVDKLKILRDKRNKEKEDERNN